MPIIRKYNGYVVFSIIFNEILISKKNQFVSIQNFVSNAKVFTSCHMQ